MKDGIEESGKGGPGAEPYPPREHILRDLRVSLEIQGRGKAVLRAPVVPEIRAGDGSLQAGAVATMVDVLAGVLTFHAVYPDWMATSGLSVHLNGRPGADAIEAEGRVIRAGRTTVIVDVEIRDRRGPADGGSAGPLGTAMISFSRLGRREDTPPFEPDKENSETVEFGIPGSGLRQPYRDAAGVRVLDEGAGVAEVEMRPYVRNSLGALQGGMIAVLADTAGETAASAAAARPMTTRDLTIQYLSQGKRGPFRTRTRVVRLTGDTALTRVEVVDRGAEDRLVAVVMNTAVANGTG
jgi:uncharacterized protein (TIGR00369 family)